MTALHALARRVLPAPLRAYAERQFARPSVRAYVELPRAPFVPYNL